MKPCAKCGYSPPKGKLGRPKRLDDWRVRKWHDFCGWSMSEIAEKYGVSKSAIAASLKRSAKK